MEEGAGEPASAWTERVQVFRPEEPHRRNVEQLDKRLARALEQIRAASCAPAQGKKPARSEEAMRGKAEAI